MHALFKWRSMRGKIVILIPILKFFRIVRKQRNRSGIFVQYLKRFQSNVFVANHVLFYSKANGSTVFCVFCPYSFYVFHSESLKCLYRQFVQRLIGSYFIRKANTQCNVSMHFFLSQLEFVLNEASFVIISFLLI